MGLAKGSDKNHFRSRCTFRDAFGTQGVISAVLMGNVWLMFFDLLSNRSSHAVRAEMCDSARYKIK